MTNAAIIAGETLGDVEMISHSDTLKLCLSSCSYDYLIG